MKNIWECFVKSPYGFSASINGDGSTIITLGTYKWEILDYSEGTLVEAYIELSALNKADDIVKGVIR